MNINKTVILILTAVLLLPMNSFAEIKTDDKIKFRQSGMSFMRWNMKIIRENVIDNPDFYNKAKVKAAIDVIKAISKSGIEDLYTSDTSSGTGWEKTRVKPELFEQREKLNKFAVKLINENQKLDKVSESGNISAIRNQFKSVARVCKGCHKKFKKKN